MGLPSQKIAIVSLSLARGGAERFAALLGQMLTNLGYEVHHIIIEADVAYPYSGQLYNLGEICKADGILWRKITKARLLGRYLDDHQIDTVIDNRTRPVWLREFMTRLIYGKRKIIYMVHSFKLGNYLPSPVLARILFADATLVCVSKAIEQAVRTRYGPQRTITIYNPMPRLNQSSTPTQTEPFILFFGRLDDKVKNFSLLLQAYALSGLPTSGYRLVIMGDGPDAAKIRQEAAALQLSDHVQLMPFQNDPDTYVRRAKFTVLSSRYEGFPMSVIESLALGVPVVSVDCQSGPSEIIRHGQNGLLVPNFDPAALAKAMSAFASDAGLYELCRANAAQSVAHLSIENIGRQWQKILRS